MYAEGKRKWVSQMNENHRYAAAPTNHINDSVQYLFMDVLYRSLALLIFYE